MNRTWTPMALFAAAALLLILAFSRSAWFGLVAVALLIAFLLYRNRASLYVALGNASHGKGDRDAALRHFRKAYETAPRNPAIAPFYGYYLLKSGRIEEAESVLNAFLASGPEGRGKLDAQMNLALVRWKQGRLQEAVAMLEEIHEQIKTTVLYGSLGYLYIEAGDLDRALRYNLEARDYNDSDPVILDNLCLTHIRRGEWEQAEEVCQSLMALSPKFPEAHYHHGLILLHKGDGQAALEKFEEALRYPIHALSTVSKEEIEAGKSEAAAGGA